MKRIFMKRILLLLSTLAVFTSISAMEMPPQSMQAELTPIRTGGKRAAQETLTPETQKASKTGHEEAEALSATRPITGGKRTTQEELEQPASKEMKGAPVIFPERPILVQPSPLPLLLQRRIRAKQLGKLLTSTSKAPITPFVIPKPYYSPENLESLYLQGIQRHAPCLILLDPTHSDKLGHILTHLLTMAIININNPSSIGFPIITSTTTFYNLIEKAHEWENSPTPENIKRKQSFPLTFDKWNIYISHFSNFVILIPKKFSAAFPNLSIKTSSLPNVSNLLPGAIHGKQKIETYQLLFEDIVGKWPATRNIDYDEFQKDFSRIFITKNEVASQQLPIWDFLIVGHGSPAPNATIAGLPPAQLNKMLSYINDNLNAGVVLLVSCSLGGKNLNLLEFEESGALKKYSFILIVGSTSDIIIQGSTNLFTFFEFTSGFGNKGASLDRLLSNIGFFGGSAQASSADIDEKMALVKARGTHIIPQVWLPNGMGFQTFNADYFVFVLGKVIAQVAAEEKQPITLDHQKAVLVYPPYIKATLNIRPLTEYLFSSKMPINIAKQFVWKDLPMVNELNFQKLIPDKHKLENEYPELKNTWEPTDQPVIFPQFISMIRGDAAHYFKKINLEDTQSPNSGVIRFIREAFLDIAKRPTLKTFIIEELTGYNDISLLIQASRMIKGFDQPHPLEVLLEQKKHQPITLYNVLISTRHDPITKQDTIVVAFTISGTTWQFTGDDIKICGHKPFCGTSDL